jgi:hypothetical protein
MGCFLRKIHLRSGASPYTKDLCQCNIFLFLLLFLNLKEYTYIFTELNLSNSVLVYGLPLGTSIANIFF